MPAPLDPAKRDAILADIRDGRLSRNAVAKKHGVSGATVTKIANAEGLTAAFDRTQTKRATASKLADLASKRAALAELLMDDAFAVRDRAWQMQTVFGVNGRTGEVVTAEIPASAGDVRNFYTSVGVIVDKVNALTRDEGGAAAASGLIKDLVDGIRAEPEQSA